MNVPPTGASANRSSSKVVVARGGAAADCGLSFAAGTLVATPDGGERAIATLAVGDQVLATDPATHQTSAQTVQHVWLNHDSDLMDVTLRTSAAATTPAASDAAGRQREAERAAHGRRAPPTDA